MFDFYYIFPIPDVTSEIFNWDYSVLREMWFYYLLILFFLIILSKVFFYFFYYPVKGALKIFWFSLIFEFFVTSLIGFILIKIFYSDLADQKGFLSFIQFLIILFYFLMDFIIASVITLTIFLSIGFFSAKMQLKTRIRAMRKYPFKFIP